MKADLKSISEFELKQVKEIFEEMIPHIEKRIADSPNGVGVFRTRDMFNKWGVTNEVWSIILAINYEEERYVISEAWTDSINNNVFEWTFRKPKNCTRFDT